MIRSNLKDEVFDSRGAPHRRGRTIARFNGSCQSSSNVPANHRRGTGSIFRWVVAVVTCHALETALVLIDHGVLQSQHFQIHLTEEGALPPVGSPLFPRHGQEGKAALMLQGAQDLVRGEAQLQ